MSSEELTPDFWDECSPEEVLFGLVSEMQKPIQTIKGYSKLLLISDLSEEERVEYLNIIVHNANVPVSIRNITDEYTRPLSSQ